MAERSDLTTFWEESPRLIEVAAPSGQIAIQDLHDTLNSNTRQASHSDDSLESLDDDPLIDSAGKENLGGGVLVGITSTLQNAQVMPESRLTATSTGTITTANAAGTRLVDSAADFVTDGVTRGALIINFDDRSVTEVLEVLDLNNLRTRPLRGGTENDFDVGENYAIWNVEQFEIAGGNLVAVDTDGVTPISPIFPTWATQVVRTSSSSATLQEQADIEFASFNEGVTIDVSNSTGKAASGTVFPTGTRRQPCDNLTDALAILNERGLEKFFIIGNITAATGLDFSGITWVGQSTLKTTITLPVAATVDNCEFEDASLSGDLDGIVAARNCTLLAVTDVVGKYVDCGLTGPITGGTGDIEFINSYSEVAGGGGNQTPEIIMANVTSLIMRGHRGGVELSGKNNTGDVSIDMDSGQVVIANDNNAGEITLRGNAKWTNEFAYTGSTVVNNELLDGQQLRELWKLLGLDPADKITITPTGITTSKGSFTITLTGDGINTTTQERTA